MTFFSCRLVTTPTFRRRLSSVLSKFSYIFFYFIRVSPPCMVSTGAVPLVTPLFINCARQWPGTPVSPFSPLEPCSPFEPSCPRFPWRPRTRNRVISVSPSILVLLLCTIQLRQVIWNGLLRDFSWWHTKNCRKIYLNWTTKCQLSFSCIEFSSGDFI